MNKQTILYIGGFELPDKNAAAHRVLGNAKAFKSLGFNVVFIGIDHTLDCYSNIINTKKNIQGFDSWALPYPTDKKQWISHLSSIDKYVEIIKMYKKVKAVVCYNFQALAFIKLLFFCRKKKIKVIADCTEWYSCRGNGLIFGIIKGIDSFIRMRIIHKKVDGLIVISRYLEKYYRDCRNVVRIPPLVDINEEKWNSDKIDDNDCLTLVYAGSPGKDKDKLDVIIESIASLKSNNIELNIIGITKNQFLKQYPHKKMALENATNRINFLGRLDHLAALRYVKSADFSIFFRDDNRMTRAGFPTKLVESISCGVPVITNATSNIQDYIKDGCEGFILAEDYSAELKELLNKPENILKDIKNNINITKFNYINFIDQTGILLDVDFK